MKTPFVAMSFPLEICDVLVEEFVLGAAFFSAGTFAVCASLICFLGVLPEAKKRVEPFASSMPSLFDCLQRNTCLNAISGLSIAILQ